MERCRRRHRREVRLTRYSSACAAHLLLLSSRRRRSALSACGERDIITLPSHDRRAPRHYMAVCDRQYSWGTAREDYVLPEAHTVVMQIAPEQLAAAGPGECVWSWQP